MKNSLLLFLSLISISTTAMMSDREPDLYSAIDYTKVFDPGAVYNQNKFQDVLEQEGLSRLATSSSAISQIDSRPGVASRLLCAVTSCCGKKTRSDAYAKSKKDDDMRSDLVTSKDLEKELVANFESKKAAAMRRSLWQPLFSLAVDSAAFGAAPHVVDMGEVGNGFSNFALVNIFAENVKKLTRAAYSIYISPLGDPLDKYEHMYIKQERFLPESLKEKIKNKMAAARQSPMAMGTALAFCQVALNLPIYSKLAQTELYSLEPHEIEDIIKGKLVGYSEKIQDSLIPPIVHHVLRSTKKTGDVHSPKSVLYFHGAPGTGKTHAAELLAKSLGVNLIKIQITSSDASALIGSDDQPGQLLEALVHGNNSKDSIILIDEIDRIINGGDETVLATVLPILEPTAKELYSPYLKSKIGIGSYCFILIGKVLPTDSAVLSRVEPVEFSCVEKEQKRFIIYNETLPALCASDRADLSLDPEHFTQPEKDFINNLIEEDSDPGMRTAQLKLSRYVDQIRIERSKHAAINGN